MQKIKIDLTKNYLVKPTNKKSNLESGKEFEVTGKQAETLVNKGFCEVVKEVAKAKTKKEKSSETPEELK